MKKLSMLLLAGATAAAPAAPGTLNLRGGLTLKPGSNVNFEIGGPDPGTGFDRLIVTGSVILETDPGVAPSKPTITVTLVNGYSPVAPAVFDVLDFGTFTGEIGDITIPSLAWSLSDLPTTGEIRLNTSGGTGFIAFLSDNGLASASSDEDFDGLTSLQEYALGRLPRVTAAPHGATALPIPGVAGGPALSLTLDVPSPAPIDVKYTVEAQTVLTRSWTALATRSGNAPWTGPAAITPLGTTGGRETLRITDPQIISDGQPRRFLRLRTEIISP